MNGDDVLLNTSAVWSCAPAGREPGTRCGVPGPAGTGTGPVQVCDPRVSVPRVPGYPGTRFYDIRSP